MSFAKGMRLCAFASGVTCRSIMLGANKRDYLPVWKNAYSLKAYSTEPKNKNSSLISHIMNNNWYRLSSKLSTSPLPSTAAKADETVHPNAGEKGIKNVTKAGPKDAAKDKPEAKAAPVVQPKEAGQPTEPNPTSTSTSKPALQSAAAPPNQSSSPPPPPPPPPSSSSSSSSKGSTPTSAAPPPPPSPPPPPPPQSPKEQKTTTDNADDLQIPDLKMPSREQVENFLFRTAVVLWDTSIYVYAIMNKAFDQYVIKHPTVKYYWSKFMNRMNEARKEMKSK